MTVSSEADERKLVSLVRDLVALCGHVPRLETHFDSEKDKVYMLYHWNGSEVEKVEYYSRSLAIQGFFECQPAVVDSE